MNSPLTPKDWELLSTYLDGQLTDPEKRQVQDLLALRPDLGQGLDELRRTRAVLRAAPMRRAPRNFTLTPAMVHQPRRRLVWGWAPSFGFASALATILLVLSFFFRLPVQAISSAAAPPAAPAPLLSRGAANGNATAPPIILWQDNGQASGLGGASGALGAGETGPGLAAGGGPTTGPDLSAQTTPTETPAVAALIHPNTLLEATATPPATGAVATAAPAAIAPAATAAPPATAEKSAAPQFAAPLATTAAASGASGAPASENGPILGIAPAQDRGKLIVPTQEAGDLYNGQPGETTSNWPWVQGGLAGVALACALAAVLIWRRSRH